MISLILSILSSTIILFIFKVAERIKVDTFSIIVINYLAALILGYSLNDVNFSDIQNSSLTWVYFAGTIGFLFIIMFFVIGLSTQKAGIGVTSIASKMSVIIPMLFSILYYQEGITALKIAGIMIALIAVALTVYKKKDKSADLKHIYLPFILFIGIGIIDSLVKFSQQEYVDDSLLPVFSALTFTMAFISGIALTIFRRIRIKRFLNRRSILAGTFLGIANFGSIYFLIRALNSNVFDSSVIFAINNIGIIALSVLLGLMLFTEKITRLNWIGIVLSFVAIGVLSLT